MNRPDQRETSGPLIATHDNRFREPDLLPLRTRIRTRLVLEYASREELQDVVRHALKKAGNPNLLTSALQDTLVEHAAGNYRVLMTLAGDLLLEACERDLSPIDEKLFLELFQSRAPRRAPLPAPRRSVSRS